MPRPAAGEGLKMNESEAKMNLKALKKLDPYIASIVAHSGQVALYKFQQGRGDWDKTEIEGTLFVYEREADPKYGFTIMNRLNMENLVEVVTKELDFQLQTPFLLYRNNSGDIYGIWFYEQAECEVVSKKIEMLIKDTEKRTAKKQGGAAGGGGGGKLGELFKTAEKKSDGKKSGPAGKSPVAAPGSKSDASGANLLRLLSQQDTGQRPVVTPSPPVSESTSAVVLDFFARASSTQSSSPHLLSSAFTSVPPGPPPPSVLPSQHPGPRPPFLQGQGHNGQGQGHPQVQGPPQGQGQGHPQGQGHHGHPQGQGHHGHPQGQGHHGHPQGHQATVTAMPISQGLSLGYVPVTSSLPPPGPPPTALPSVAGLPHGLPPTVAGVSHGLLPAVVGLPGVHSVESLEAEQRRKSPPSGLTEIELQLRQVQLGSSHHFAPVAPGQQGQGAGQGVTLLSPQVFSSQPPARAASPPSLAQAGTRPGSGRLLAGQASQGQAQAHNPGHHQLPGQGQGLQPGQAQPHHPGQGHVMAVGYGQHLPPSQGQGNVQLQGQGGPGQPRQNGHSSRHNGRSSPPPASALTPGQMVEAMSYLLETDPHFVQKLHEAYILALNRKLQTSHV